MRGLGEILLVSTYELGHQPLGLAMPQGFLERAGFRPAALDLAVEALDPARARAARLIAVSVPMHTALRLGVEAARRLRHAAPEARLAFHGLYAPLNAELLLAEGAVAVLGGECEEELVALAEAVEREEEDLSRFVERGGAAARTARLDYPVPSRRGLPPLSSYARLDKGGGEERLAGYAEASRGCKHLCRHCPIPPVYGGRFVAVPVETVLDDVAAQVLLGARHLTFGDPDFLNGPTHALRVARGLRARFPEVSFDFTAKVEHLVKCAEMLGELRSCGALFVTSAVESFSDRVLARLAKGHTRADALRAFDLCSQAGIALRPSLLPFTPWGTLDDLVELFDLLEARGLLQHLDPVQLTVRLLVPPGSLLEGDPEIDFTLLDRDALTWRWRHPDPRMDALQPALSAAAEEGARVEEPPIETTRRLRDLVRAAAGLPPVDRRAPTPDQPKVPRLTESWFCCAEPTCRQLAPLAPDGE